MEGGLKEQVAAVGRPAQVRATPLEYVPPADVAVAV
jgi:hypothetical protein